MVLFYFYYLEKVIYYFIFTTVLFIFTISPKLLLWLYVLVTVNIGSVQTLILRKQEFSVSKNVNIRKERLISVQAD